MKIDWENQRSGKIIKSIGTMNKADYWEVSEWSNQPGIQIVSGPSVCPFCHHWSYNHPSHEFLAHSWLGQCIGTNQYIDSNGVYRISQACDCKLSNGESYGNWKLQMELASDDFARGKTLEEIRDWWNAGNLFPIREIKPKPEKNKSWFTKLFGWTNE